MINVSDRLLCISLIREAAQSGCRLEQACEELGLSVRTFQRWVRDGEAVRADGRSTASRPEPSNKLSEAERQPSTIGALPVAVARAERVLVAYLPGLAMRRIADLHAGEARTDARDATIIAEAARSMPHTLRSLRLADEQLAELTMLCGFDDDLAAQVTQTSNRIRGLLAQTHPALERYPSPAALAATSEKTLANRLTKLAPHGQKPAAVIVPGTQAATIVMPRLAQQLAALRKQRDEIAAEVERLVLPHPLWPVLTSMPGVGVRTATRLLTEVAHKAFASAAHLAAYAGPCPGHPALWLIHPR